jgi:uroporphyrinogen decarboxylase
MTAGPAALAVLAGPPVPVADPRTDRYLRAALRLPVDVTPVWFMRQAGRSLPEFRAIRERASLVEITRDAALCAEVTLQPVRRLGVDAAILFADITTPLTGIGVDFEITPGVGPVIERPIASEEDVERLRQFEPAEAVGPLLEAIRLIRAESPVPLIGFAGAPFTLACYLIDGGPSREFPKTRLFMHAQPAAWDALMARLVDATVAYLGAQVAAGAQAVQVFDSWVGGLSPFDYRRSVQPWMARLWDGIERLGVPSTHFGVGTAGLLRLQAEAGGDVIGLDWRIALDEGWSLVGNRAVQGNLDPALLLGPWPDVDEAARWILDLAGGRPGHVFNLGHGVIPETDPDVLRRLVDLVHSHRTGGA